MSIYHEAILKSLPDATRETKTTKAYLLDYEQTRAQGQYLWAFLTNPQQLEFTRQAKYNEAQTLSAKKADWQYGYTSGRTLSISDIVLDGWCKGKTIMPLLDGIEALLEADVSKGKFAPTILSFVFGSRRFGPCVLTSVKWTETGWLGGMPARSTMSISVQEVPAPLTKAELEAKRRAATSILSEAKQKVNSPRLLLTERQVQAVITQSRAIIQKGISEFNPTAQALFKSGSFKIDVDREKGDVFLLDRSEKRVGTLARFDGKHLNFTNSTLLKPGVKL